MSNAKANGSIKLICQTCSKEHIVKGNQFDFNYQITKPNDEGNMENIFVADYTSHCDCNENILTIIQISEYPARTLSCVPLYQVVGADRQGEFNIYFY